MSDKEEENKPEEQVEGGSEQLFKRKKKKRKKRKKRRKKVIIEDKTEDENIKPQDSENVETRSIETKEDEVGTSENLFERKKKKRKKRKKRRKKKEEDEEAQPMELEDAPDSEKKPEDDEADKPAEPEESGETLFKKKRKKRKKKKKKKKKKKSQSQEEFDIKIEDGIEIKYDQDGNKIAPDVPDTPHPDKPEFLDQTRAVDLEKSLDVGEKKQLFNRRKKKKRKKKKRKSKHDQTKSEIQRTEITEVQTKTKEEILQVGMEFDKESREVGDIKKKLNELNDEANALKSKIDERKVKKKKKKKRIVRKQIVPKIIKGKKAAIYYAPKPHNELDSERIRWSLLGPLQLLFQVAHFIYLIIIALFYISFFMANPDYIRNYFSATTAASVVVIIFLCVAEIVGLISVVLGLLGGWFGMKNDHKKSRMFSMISFILSLITMIIIVICLLISFIVTVVWLDNIIDTLWGEINSFYVVAHICVFLFSLPCLLWIIYGFFMWRKQNFLWTLEKLIIEVNEKNEKEKRREKKKKRREKRKKRAESRRIEKESGVIKV